MTTPATIAGKAGIAETYAGEFALRGVTLPLAALASAEKPGRILDATGAVVAGVNPAGRTEQEMYEIARLIAQGVNWFANMRSGT